MVTSHIKSYPFQPSEYMVILKKMDIPNLNKSHYKMNIINKLKQCLINPCNRCLVYGCCNNACKKLAFFVKSQSIIWITIGFIITTSLLITFIYNFYPTYNIIALILFIIGWLFSGFMIYKVFSSPNKDNKFMVMFSFIWWPYLVFVVVIGMLLALLFTKKRTVKFIAGDIWKEKKK